MMKVKDILSYLESLYPPHTACDFDNVGLLVGDSESGVTGAVAALDCDINAVKFAKENGANLIITHHPVIFDPLKSVTENSIVFHLIKNGISVISMHTNLDVGAGGVNDLLCEKLCLKDIISFTAADGYLLKCGTTDIANADDFAAFIKKQLGGFVRYVAGNKPVRKVLVCSGAGGNYIGEAISGGFDALVTADVKHNHFIDAVNAGISLFDGGHFNTENIIVKPLCSLLQNQFTEIKFTAFSPGNIKTL